MTASANPAGAAEGRAPEVPDFRDRQLALFNASVLKQAKWRELLAATGATAGLAALDLGSDNGVISWLFRQRGGEWSSADLTDETVDAIRAMVGERVYRLESGALPFADASLDLVVVVDMLEHLADDRLLLAEIARCLRPGGHAVVHAPTRKRRGLLPAMRHALGLTDAWHGHVHSGYDRDTLERLLPAELRLVKLHTYSRFFSQLLDTALNWMYLRRSRGRAVSTAKGMVVTGAGVDTRSLGTLARLYPLMRAFAALDVLLPWTRGYMLIARLERVPANSPS